MNNNISRRSALIFAAGLAIIPLWKYLSPKDSGAEGIEISFDELPENGVYMLRNRKAAVIRKKNELKAISIACTHLGCTLNVAGDEFVCPCHGSKFTLEGKVLKGPAVLDLKELRYELVGGIIKIYI